MNKTFTTRKGLLLGVILWGIVFLQLYRVGITGLLELGLMQVIISLLLLILVGVIWFGIQYKISDERLIVKLGPFPTYSVNINKIEAVSRSYNPLSSPAPSLHRINLRLENGRFLLLAPKDEKRFIQRLIDLNPKIVNHLSKESTGGFKGFLIKLL